MNDHYYTVHPTSAHDERTVTVEALEQTLRFTTDAGVFSRDGLDVGTRVLLGSLPELHGRVLDLGCGWGAIGVTIAAKYPAIDLVMTDINERCVELSKRNLQANRAKAQVVQGDAFENVEGKFDCILTNPPIRAGKAAIYAMFRTASERLNENGELYLVIRKQQGAPSALKYLSTLFDTAEVIEREAGFWILRCTEPKTNEG